MKNRVCFLFFTVSSLFSFGQTYIDTTSVLIYDSISHSSTDISQYLGLTKMEEDSVYNFQFDTLNEMDFTRFKNAYRTKINMDSSKIVRTDTSFVIKTNNSMLSFPADEKDYSEFCDYLGIIEPLNLFIVSDIDGKNEVGCLVLVDKKTGKNYYFESPFDEPCEIPLISPGNKYLLAFANTWYEHDRSFISILKIKKVPSGYQLQDFKGLYLNHGNIENLVWINDAGFAVSVAKKTEAGDDNPPVERKYYLKISF